MEERDMTDQQWLAERRSRTLRSPSSVAALAGGSDDMQDCHRVIAAAPLLCQHSTGSRSSRMPARGCSANSTPLAAR
jgi:hypothetical protein